MILRDYQQECSDAVIREFAESDSTLVVLPTGCGKTIVFADIIRRMHPQRAIVIAHREELIFQARDKIKQVTGLGCEIEMGDYSARTDSLFEGFDVLVSTVQTQNAGRGKKRMERFNPLDFGLLVIDEAHHATAQSYRDVIAHYRQNEDLRVLGVTATPDRTDEAALGQIFKTVAYDYEILDAIHAGYLVPIHQRMVTVGGLDFSQCRTTAGDLNGADLAKIMEAEEMMQGIASASIEIIGHRRTVVFTASVKQAETISEIFNRHRLGMSEWVCGATEKGKRREILEKFQAGKIQIVCNCGVLTEGFDNPGVECIVMARPTKSRSLYAQMAGRSTRTLPGVIDGISDPAERRVAIAASAKPTCEIVDFCGNSGRHKLITTADILGGKVSDEAVELAAERAREKGANMQAVDMTEELDAAQKDVEERREEARRREAARKAKLVARAAYSSVNIDPFDVFGLTPTVTRGWDTGRTLSQKQRDMLQKNGLDPDALGPVAGQQILNEMFRRWNGKLCTMKQAKLLKRHGYETRDLPMAEAGKLIDALAKNGWRRPAA